MFWNWEDVFLVATVIKTVRLERAWFHKFKTCKTVNLNSQSQKSKSNNIKSYSFKQSKNTNQLATHTDNLRSSLRRSSQTFPIHEVLEGRMYTTSMYQKRAMRLYILVREQRNVMRKFLRGPATGRMRMRRMHPIMDISLGSDA